MKNITIIGSGSFGCALAHVFSKNNNIKIWSFTKEETDSINNKHECLQIPSIKLDNNIKCYQDYLEAIDNSDIIVLVTPSNTIKKTCHDIKQYINNQEILLASKGMDDGKLLSEIIYEELGINPSIIMGPSFAKEIGEDILTYVELSGNKELLKTLETDNFRIIYNNDSIGLQVGGAFKNVISLACGIAEGLGYKMNTISYIITEGLKEIKEIGIKLGAKEATFYGLSGLGDLYGTTASIESRNKRAGLLIAQGKTLDEIKKEVGTTIEGLDSLKEAYKLIIDNKLDCPLICKIYGKVYNNE